MKLKNGNRNILIGRGANVSKENAMNQIVIGSNSVGHGDNKMVLGNNNLISIDPAVNGKINLGSKEYKYENIYIGGNIYKDKQKIGLNFLNDCTLVGPDAVGNLFIGKNVGAKTLYNGVDLSTGGSNVVIGQGAFQENTTGYNNVGLGESVLKVNTTGEYNVAIGDSVLESNTTGSRNTASGYASLFSNTTGNNNTAYGYQAGNTITTGSNNTIIGYDADVSAAGVDNEIVIGNSSVAKVQTGSGKILASIVTGTNTSPDNSSTGLIPDFIGQIYVDISSGSEKMWMAFGTTIGNWKQISNA